MKRLSSEAIDLVQLYQGQLTQLALVDNLEELTTLSQAALATLLPGCRAQICWLELLRDDELPDEWVLAYLREGTSVADTSGALVAVRAAGELLGFVKLSPPSCGAENELSLSLLVSVIGPMYLALRRAPPPLLERRKAELRLAIEELRGAVALQPLMHNVCALVRSALPFANVICTLRYRDSKWLEDAYCLTAAHQGPLPVSWRTNAGLTSTVIDEGNSLYTQHYQQECRTLDLPNMAEVSAEPIYGWMGVPMRDNAMVFGALVSFSTQAHQVLRDDDQALFIWLTQELSHLIRTTQRYERAAEEVRRREVLSQITRAITSSLDPEHVPTLILRHAPELFNAEEGSLMLLDPATHELVVCYASRDVGQQLLGQRVPPGMGVAGAVVSSGQPMIVNNTSDDQRFYRGLDGTTGFTTRSILAVPLRGLTGIVGVIEILNRQDHAPFTPDDLVLLEALANHALIALENARKFASIDQALTRRLHELDRSNDRLHKILRASNDLRSERQLDDLLPRIAEIVRDNSGFQSAVIALVRRDHMAEPYLQQFAAAGPAADEIEHRLAQAPLSRLETLVRSEYSHGRLTYLIKHGHTNYVDFWGGPQADAHQPMAELQPESWPARDTLFCLLNNSRGELIGLLGVDHPEGAAHPSDEQVQILEILANQAAAMIENAQLYADQQLNLNRLLALTGLGRAISTTLRSPQQIYELTTCGMQELSEASWATLYLGERAEADLSLSFHIGSKQANPAATMQIARKAIAVRRPVSHLPSPELGDTALIGIPLCGSRRALGAICVGYAQNLPGTADVETLTMFASQAATAVESLRLLGEVREGRDRLISILASTLEGMLLVSEEERIAVVNKAFLSLIAADQWPNPPTSIVELNDTALSSFLERWQANLTFPPSQYQQLVKGLASVVDGAKNFSYGQLTGTNPTLRSLEWTVLRAARKGTRQKAASEVVPPQRWPILLTLRDITAAKETERLRSDLTNMMVHDLRSPLTSIITSIDMIFRGITGEINAVQRDILGIAYSSAQNLLNMVNLLLDISRLEDGGMPLDCTSLLIADLVNCAVERIKVLALEKNISLSVALDPVLEHVYADSELVLRVLQNLLDNALKFSSKGGMIRLEAELVSSDECVIGDEDRPVQQLVRFAIHDTGIGIKAADLDKIFHKFSQIGNRRNAGSGLGLTFCKLVIEAHKGQIWVESTPDSGSTFYFTLPVAL